MTNLKLGSRFPVYSYKHSGEFHRMWRQETLLDKTNDIIVVGKTRTKVIESSGKNWMTHDPSISFFFKNRFFNIMAMLRKEGVFYYCNMASPAVIDNEGLKYIDYDLDVSVNNKFEYKVLDRKEYEYHIKKYEYPKELVKVINHHFKILINMIESRSYPFNHEVIKTLYELLKKQDKRKRL
ncbi:MAG: DUF402 domain-containing protein [Acholeplasmataceae bacterium]|nr:DUF402 domain-containing protein [Acholeplasmataceae bacterium]